MSKRKNTMVRDMKDLKKQSKIMENMKTNKQVKQGGKLPDPIQYKHTKSK
ncbi:hypothetical protein JOC75_002317 [Metabacillus crassostreae]|nr:hypothetical protein [Metabacillus crassostreae]MBM7604344.1 hypothetical protein [Metabacillus crassostreae]